MPEPTPLWPAGAPLLIAGPCVLEDADETVQIAASLAELASRRSLPFVFKASFDKANRTAGHSFRGPGLTRGLAILERVKREVGCPVLTDIHEPSQAPAVAEVVDVLQIPAFLCRQTDLLAAAAATGSIVNVKKGQFLAPGQVGPMVGKLDNAAEVWLTERGTAFGHGDLVVDFRSVDTLAAHGRPVFDASHCAQRPGGAGDASSGDRAVIPALVGAAAGAGFDGLFLEVHPAPERALSDRDTQWPLADVGPLVDRFLAIRAARP